MPMAMEKLSRAIKEHAKGAVVCVLFHVVAFADRSSRAAQVLQGPKFFSPLIVSEGQISTKPQGSKYGYLSLLN